MELISFWGCKQNADVRKAKCGDKECFLALINRYRLDIYRASCGILTRKEDIEDAIQNTIIKAYENIESLKYDKYFKTWLIRILINECTNILNKNKRVILVEEEKKIEENYLDEYENIDLMKAINSLGEEIRCVTVLFYLEDMSIKEIAEVLNIPDGTVRSRLARARHKLKECLSKEAAIDER